MHLGCDCEKCIFLNVCKLIKSYNDKALELTDYNDDNYVSELKCKYYEERKE